MPSGCALHTHNPLHGGLQTPHPHHGLNRPRVPAPKCLHTRGSHMIHTQFLTYAHIYIHSHASKGWKALSTGAPAHTHASRVLHSALGFRQLHGQTMWRAGGWMGV